jgi:hypothetical protein
MVISHWVVLSGDVMLRNNVASDIVRNTPEDVYRGLACSYPKFFKMDKLCKWAFVASEYLFAKNDELYKDIDKNNIAIALTTSHGCLDVDKRYLETIDMPSPALFVYTLPNIMLGEISIRRGFKGEQLCMVSEQFDADELYFAVERLLNSGGMDACLCGWADATGDSHDVVLFWVTKGGEGAEFDADAMRDIYRHAPVPFN